MPSSDHRSPLLDVVNKRLAKTSVHAPDGSWPPPGRSVANAFADVDRVFQVLRALKTSTAVPPAPTANACPEVEAIVRDIVTSGWPDSAAYATNWPGINAQQLLFRQSWEIGQVVADMCNAIALAGGGGGDNGDPHPPGG